MKIKAPRPTLSSVPSASPAPGEDTQKAVQQLLQNAFQPAPQAAPPPPPRKHTQESFQPAPSHGADTMKAVQQLLQNAYQPAPPPAPPQKKKHTEASFQPAPAPGEDAMKAVQQHLQNAFQHAPQAAPPHPPKKRHTEASFQHAAAAGAATKKAVKQLLQNAFQPSPQTKRKALEYRPAFASFASNLKEVSKLAQAAFQAAPAPSSGGWSTVSINSNGTFTLPLIGTYPLPSPGQMKKIDLQDGKFFKIRQRADGAYEGKFGPDSLPAPQQPKPSSQPPPGWQRVNVDADGMIRLPGHTKSFYPPQPGKTDTLQLEIGRASCRERV